MILASIVSEVLSELLGGVVSAVESVVKALENIGGFITYGVIVAVNDVFYAVELALKGFVSLLGFLPAHPSLAAVPHATEIISWANWVFPFGPFITYCVGLVVCVTTFFAVRYVLHLIKFV